MQLETADRQLAIGTELEGKLTGLLQELVDMAVELLVRKVELGDNLARVLGKAHCEDARRWRGECERRVSGTDALVADGELRGQGGQRPE